MSKHTPGPWIISAGDNVYDTDGTEIASIEYALGAHRDNARLIAAATELLAACKAALPIIGTCVEDDHGAYDKLRAAIAKAEGGDS